MNNAQSAISLVVRYGTPLFLGLLLAIALHQAWDLRGRWFYVVIIGTVLVSVSLLFIRVFSDYLMVVLMLGVPFAGFGKWFFPDNLRPLEASSPLHNATLEGLIGLGVLDFVLAALYFTWFVRIFVTREQELPKPNILDLFVLLFLAINIISALYAPKSNLAIHASSYIAKFALLYLYVSRNVNSKHIKWLVVSFVAAIFFEAAMSFVQHTTGKLVGVALDKGSGSQLEYQYSVPGTSQWFRATGTTYDSHTLGLYMAMLAPFMYSLILMPRAQPRSRLVFAAALGLALATLIMTFTRSGWVACAVSMTAALGVTLFVWRDRRVVPLLIFGFFTVLLSAPWSIDLIIERFRLSPIETLSNRFEGYEVAMYIWSQHFLFGAGAGNYIELLYKYNYGWNQEMIVHNTILWIGSETGLVGLFAFYGTIAIAMRRFWKMLKCDRTLLAHIGFGGFVALIAFIVEGMATPMHKEPTTYTMFWFLIALSVVLPPMQKRMREEAAGSQSTSP